MFWKIFFIFNVIIISMSLITEFIYPEYAEMNGIYVVQYISSIVGAIALYGLAFKKVIFNRAFWQIALPIILIVDILYPAITIYVERNEIFSDLSDGIGFPVVFALVVGIIYTIIYFVGLIRYVIYVYGMGVNHITIKST